MDTSRIISIVLSELALDNLKEQESLETTINSTTEIGIKVRDIKSTLHRLVVNELMITKFQALVTPQPSPIPDTKTTENG